MGALIFISVAILLGMMYLGLYLITEWDPESRLIGVCTSVWVGLAIYLFISQWLLGRQHEPYSLVAITLLGTTGYIVGKTIAAIHGEARRVRRESARFTERR